MIPRSLSHVAVGVRDMDRSLPFYRDLLGFQVAQEINDLDGNENHWEESPSGKTASIGLWCSGTARRLQHCTASMKPRR